MRANAHHATTVTKSSRTAHVEFTSSSRHVHELVRVAVWTCLLTHMIKCSSRIDVTSYSRLVYAPHEQFVHDTSSSRRIHKQFMSRSRLLSHSCNRVDAAHQALYVGTSIRFIWLPEHDSQANVGYIFKSRIFYLMTSTLHCIYPILLKFMYQTEQILILRCKNHG